MVTKMLMRPKCLNCIKDVLYYLKITIYWAPVEHALQVGNAIEGSFPWDVFGFLGKIRCHPKCNLIVKQAGSCQIQSIVNKLKNRNYDL